MKRAAMGLIIGLAAVSAGAQYLDEDFDALPAGPISSQPGWESSYNSLPVILSGAVTNVHPWSGSKSVLLAPVTSGLLLGTRVQYTNFQSSASEGLGPVVRASAWIYRDNLNDALTVRLDHDGQGQILVGTDVADGSIVLSNAVSGISWDSDYAWATGRYAHMVIRYDFTNNTTSLDYDGQTLVEWMSMGGSAPTWLNRFGVFRPYAAASSGMVLVDSMTVEGFPANTYAWWRFDEVDAHHAEDHVGSLFVSRAAHTLVTNAPPSEESLLCETRDVTNRRAWQWFSTSNTWVTRRFNATNWTLEAIVHLTTNSQPGLLVLETSTPSANTNSVIEWFVMESATGHMVMANLRDGEETGNACDSYGNLGVVPADGQWHHLALVKNSGSLYSYVDYSVVSQTAARSRSAGGYRFNITAKVSIGKDLLGTVLLSGPDDRIDELRISRAALSASKFLRPSQPQLKKLSVTAPGLMQVTFRGPVGESFSVPLSTNFFTWQAPMAFAVVSTGNLTTFDLMYSNPVSGLGLSRTREP